MLYTIYADFQNADVKGRVRLNTFGTANDLKKLGIALKEGMEVILDDCNGVITKGIISYSDEEKLWVAKINWDDLKNL